MKVVSWKLKDTRFRVCERSRLRKVVKLDRVSNGSLLIAAVKILGGHGPGTPAPESRGSG